jgi:protein arginine kinase
MGFEMAEPLFYVAVDKAPVLERNFLVERHLISRNHAFGKGPRGAVVSHSESFTAMINEEDHLRIQVLFPGCQISRCASRINEVDDFIESKMAYAFSSRYGYLTACPTNVGTGIRVSVMLHLPALKITNQIKKFMNAARDMNLAVRGLFGEGSEAAGDFYQVSNQVTLGVSESDIVEQFEKHIIPEIVEFETEARKYLVEKNSAILDDKISRALALLKNAKLLSSQETLFLLSHLRLGLNIKKYLDVSTPAIDELTNSKFTQLNIKTINKLFLLTLPAHLQMNYGKTLEPTRRDILRAEIIRSAFKPVN